MKLTTSHPSHASPSPDLPPCAHSPLPDAGLSAAALRLLAVVGGGLLLMAPFAWSGYGPSGVLAATLAAALSSATSLASLAFASHHSHGGQVQLRVLVGMGLRMGIPLAVCLLVARNRSVDALAGFVYFLLVFYMLTLATETWLSLAQIKRGQLPKE